jgi:hypothetical protein
MLARAGILGVRVAEDGYRIGRTASLVSKEMAKMRS